MLAAGAVLILLALAPMTIGAEPSPVMIDPLDPRAEGEGAGIVGQPLLAAIAVILLGMLAAAGTAVYARWVARR